MKIKSKIRDNQLIVKVKISSSEGWDNKELEFLSEASVRGLLAPKKVRRNAVEYIGPSGIPMCEYLKRAISKYDFYYFMLQIVEAAEKIRVEKLSMNKLLFDLSYVYVNEGTKELEFLYIPVQFDGDGMDPMEFMEKIMYTIKPEEDVGNSIVRYANFIRAQKSFDSDAVKAFIAEEDDEIGSIIRGYNNRSGKLSDMRQIQEEDEDTILMDSATELIEEETGFLDMETENSQKNPSVHWPSLIRSISRERVEINKQVFRLGKGSDCVDYHVDNAVVSRSHADIVTRDGRYYVCDQNSMNHTYLNDVILPAKIEVEIHDGDQLRLADEEFEFHI